MMEKFLMAFFCMAGLSLAADVEDQSNKSKQSQPAHFDYQLPESIEMPGGEIYYHPKVVEVRPDGITIMHDCGVAFWPFSQLPPAICNMFHYNAAAAQKYTDEMLLRRQKIDELNIKRKIEAEHQQVYHELVSQRYYCTYLRMKIDALKRRIAADKQKEQRLDNNINQDRQVIAKEASGAGNNNNGGLGIWNNSGNDGNSTRMAVIGEFDTDWKNDKTDYEMWNFAAGAATNNLAVYQQEYQEAMDKNKSLAQAWANIQKTDKHDQGKLDRQIHETVNKEINDSMLELEKLREMRNQQLITTDEYIRKKAEILKRF